IRDFHVTGVQTCALPIYHSWWAYTIFALLAVNLAAVMVDRLPWKRRHFSFLMAHIGILMLLGGSLLTRNLGIDGIMRLGISETRSEERRVGKEGRCRWRR